MRGRLDLLKDLAGHLGSLALVRNKRPVNIESIFVGDKRSAPSLLAWRHGICCFDSDQQPPLEVEDSVDIEENLVDGIARDDALCLEHAFQVVEVFEILNVLALRVDQLFDDVIAVAQL